MKNRMSLFVLTMCFGVMVYTGFFFYPKWTKSGTEATISWDVSGYYLYLPAIFIYNDLKECRFQKEIGDTYSPTPNFEQARLHNHTNGRVIQYTYGQALAISPFFFLAHGYSKYIQQYPPDGFSFPYQICIGLGMFLYSLAAVYLLRKILLHYFNDKIVGLLLILLLICSPLLNYLAIDQAQANSFLFFLYTLIIYLSIKFHQSPTIYGALFISFLCCFATLVRPTDIICIVIPLFWGVNNFREFKQRVSFWIIKKNWIFIAVLPFIILPAFQFVYWKYVLDEWLVYSYQNQGFSWLNPHIISYFFGAKSGFLAYSPSMIFAYLGLLFFWKYGRERVSILILVFCSHYIITAWDGIDYGWYSGRAMIQYFPILAFPFASFLEFVFRIQWLKFGFLAITAALLYFNIWWTYHIHKGTIGAMNLTSQQYWNHIGRWH